MRLVLDTNVLAAGLRSRNGASFDILALVASRRLTPLVTTALLSEYEAVLKRPEQREATGLTHADIDDVLAEFAYFAQGVHVHFRWRPQLVDAADEMVLDAAVNGCADALITFNIRHLDVACRRFGIPVLRPGDLLRRLL